MPLGDLQQPFDLIVIGRGAAAADYLLSVPRRYKSLAAPDPLPLTILVIGEKDPWADARGYVKGAYAQYVNQEKTVLQRRTGDTAPLSPGPQDRREFARENADIIESLADEVLEGTVRRVSKVAPEAPTDRLRFKVQSTAGEYYAHKVVFASGAGVEGEKGHADYHAVPPEVKKAWPKGPPPGVMNLDRFIKFTETQSLAGKKVAVLGPTAGTDATMTALTVKVPPANLYWLMRGAPTTKGFDNVYTGATAEERDRMKGVMDTAAKSIVSYRADTLSLAGSDRITIRCTQTNSKATDPLMGRPLDGEAVRFEVDYFVYSIGQTAANTLTAPPTDARSKALRVLDPELEEHLEPVYDVNQRLGNAPWEHVTAIQLEGSDSADGLLVIGAAAFQMAPLTDHNFLQLEFHKLQVELIHESGFQATAQAHYPELLDDSKLQDAPRLPKEDCRAKARAFRLAWRTYLDQRLDKYVGMELVSGGDKSKIVADLLRKADHLCYLLEQRCQAAAYLFDPAAKGRKVQDMLNPSQTLPASLSDCRLLAAVNANIGALNASSPKHLQGKTVFDPLTDGEVHANYLEDKTELRCYIAAHYPDIDEPAAEGFIRRVTEERKKLGNMGFGKPKIAEFEAQLERLEAEGKLAKSV